MYPAGMINPDSDRREGVSCAGVYTAADRERVVEVLASLGFSGWIGPAQGRWVLVVAENPLGKVAAGKRTIDEVGRDLAATTGALTLVAQIRRDEALRLWLYNGDQRVATVDTNPPEPEFGAGPGHDEFGGAVTLDEFGEPMLEEFGEPVGMAMFEDDSDGLTYAPIAQALEVPEVSEELTELLEDELSEDESESERLTAMARLLGLPTWLVSATSLPKDIWGGPRREEMIRLQVGRQGAAGALHGFVTRRTTRRPPARPERP